jgi:hypothetical protein
MMVYLNLKELLPATLAAPDKPPAITARIFSRGNYCGRQFSAA